jgi:hypothetical protein
VYDRSGTRIGVVEHVMADGNIFEGLIIQTHPLPGRHLYADDAQVAEIRERGVLLLVDSDELHDPRRETGRRQPDGLSASTSWSARNKTLPIYCCFTAEMSSEMVTLSPTSMFPDPSA